MKIKLSQSDWKLIGQKTGWLKESQMRNGYAIKQLALGWAFVIKFGMVPTPIGRNSQLYFETKEDIIKELESLGVKPDEYDVL